MIDSPIRDPVSAFNGVKALARSQPFSMCCRVLVRSDIKRGAASDVLFLSGMDVMCLEGLLPARLFAHQCIRRISRLGEDHDQLYEPLVHTQYDPFMKGNE